MVWNIISRLSTVSILRVLYTPALWINTSIFLSRADNSFAIECTSAMRVKSAIKYLQSTPYCSLTRLDNWMDLVSFLLMERISAPWEAYFFTVSKPIPEVAPVITTKRPGKSSSQISGSNFSFRKNSRKSDHSYCFRYLFNSPPIEKSSIFLGDYKLGITFKNIDCLVGLLIVLYSNSGICLYGRVMSRNDKASLVRN